MSKIKSLGLFTMILAVSSPLIITVACGNEDDGFNRSDPSSWQLVWEDKFEDEEAPLSDNYNFDLGNGSALGIPGWGNREQQIYTNEEKNVSVVNDKLVINAVKELNQNGLGYGWTSTRIKTKHSQTFGAVEIKALLPKGTGLWPAIWMLPDSYDTYGPWPNSGEIDIMEARGRLPDKITSALHFNGGQGHKYLHDEVTLPNNGTFDDGYHIYKLEWTKNYIKTFVDGNLILEQDSFITANESNQTLKWPQPFDKDFHLLINLAIGGQFDNDLLDPNLPNENKMLIDYIKFYR